MWVLRLPLTSHGLSGLTAGYPARIVLHSHEGMTGMPRSTEISGSFSSLRAIADSFAAPPQRPGQRRRLYAIAGELGSTVVPLLCRHFASGDVAQAEWAACLLGRDGSPRTLRALRELAADARLPEARRALALALLGDLGAPLPAAVRILDE